MKNSKQETEDEIELVQQAINNPSKDTNAGNPFTPYSSLGHERQNDENIDFDYEKAEDPKFMDKMYRTAPKHKAGESVEEYAARIGQHYENLTGKPTDETDGTAYMMETIAKSLMNRKFPNRSPDRWDNMGRKWQEEGKRKTQGKPLGREHAPD